LFRGTRDRASPGVPALSRSQTAPASVLANSPIWAQGLDSRLSPPYREGQDIQKPTLHEFMTFFMDCTRHVLKQAWRSKSGLG